MRGEYKVPGGKLVAVDVHVSDGRIDQVRISGDFFLEPDDALEWLNDALVGLPSDANVTILTSRIETVLTDDVTMVGFTPESIAIAIRRALGHATDWDDHDFDLIHEAPRSPTMHMALDEVIAREVGDGIRNPTLRVWEWGAPCVVIGSFQSLANEVDPDGARRHGIEVVRRISGGGAMFIEPGNTITYSLTVPASLVEGLSFAASYAFLDDWVLGALSALGIEARYVPLNDIASAAGKIAGAAQKRLANGAVLHHVTMAYDIDAAKMMEVLRIGREKMSDKGTTSAAKRVDPLRSQTGMPREAIVDAFIEYFRGRYGLRAAKVGSRTEAEAEGLVASKFGTVEWTARVP